MSVKLPSFRRGVPTLLVASLLVASLQGHARTTGPLVTTAHEKSLRYSRVAFTGSYIDGADTRFRVAEEGFRFRSGVSLESRDPILRTIRWFDGSLSSGRLRDGRAIVLWPSLFARPVASEVRIAQTAELAGQETGRIAGREIAPSHPEIPGYRYITSENLVGTRQFLGLWHRVRGPDQTLIASFQPLAGSQAEVIIGHVPLRLNSIYVSMPLHGVSWNVTFTGEAARGHSVYILHYQWIPSGFRPLPSGQPHH